MARPLHAGDIPLIRKDRHMTQNDPGNDYPLSEVPLHARKGLASTATVSYTHLTLPTICSV